jgi:hypothetical protein
MNNILKLGLSAVAAIAFTHSHANANSITLGSVSATPSGGGGSDWTYSYTFANSELQNGDFFTINDFGLATVVVAPINPAPNWVFSQSLTGTSALPSVDNPSVLNVTFTWTDGTINLGPGPLGAFTFVLHSPLAAIPVDHDYTSLDHIASGLTAGNESRVIGSVAGPLTVPDGGSAVALLGLALASVEGLRRKLRIA